MISLPLVPREPDMATALAPLGNALVRVWAYDNGDLADPWKMYEPGHPANDLFTLDVESGYWFEMRAPALWTVSGQAMPLAALPLRTGWNFFGYPVLSTAELPSATAGIADRIDLIWHYDAADSQDPWKRYSPTMPAWTNDLLRLAPGKGYWILVTGDCVLQVP
jgi:hypothetical protein